MRWLFILLFYGVVLMVNGLPYYNDYEGYDPDEMYDTGYMYEEPLIGRAPRSLDNIIKKTSNRAINLARDFIRTFLPSAAQMGYPGVTRIARSSETEKGTPLSHAAVKKSSISTTPTTTSSGYSSYYNYQYPGMGFASMYGYPGYNYGSYQYPFYAYNSAYQGQYDASKRNYMPYSSYSNIYYPQSSSQNLRQQASYYKYPSSFATSTAVKQTIANPEPAKARETITVTEPTIPDTNTASGISQGLIDLENDVNGFNQAIQYMKEAFIAENKDGSSDLSEKIHNSKMADVVGDKKDLIKKKKTSSELLDAFKRTLDSKERLENKLVNYFTNYVCGDDC